MLLIENVKYQHTIGRGLTDPTSEMFSFPRKFVLRYFLLMVAFLKLLKQKQPADCMRSHEILFCQPVFHELLFTRLNSTTPSCLTLLIPSCFLSNKIEEVRFFYELGNTSIFQYQLQWKDYSRAARNTRELQTTITWARSEIERAQINCARVVTYCFVISRAY